MEESLNCGADVNKTNLAEAVGSVFSIKKQDLRTYSPLTLAYIGDSIYDLIIKTMLVEERNDHVNKLHQKASSFVKASAQMQMYHDIEPLLTEEEKAVFRRGRNAKSYTMAKNATVTEYRNATGFEALCGYLYLNGETDRLLMLIKSGIDNKDRSAMADREV